MVNGMEILLKPGSPQQWRRGVIFLNKTTGLLRKRSE
jgi:hypothetical protein